MSQKVEYIVELTRKGNGAAEATQQLKQLDNAARVAGNGAIGVSGNLGALSDTAKGSTLAIRELTSVMFLLGGPKIQEAAVGVSAFANGLNLVKLAAKGIGAGAAATLTGLAVAAGAYGYSLVKVAQSEEAAAQAAIQGQQDLVARADKIRDALINAIEDGRAKIKDETVSLWDAILARPTDASLRKLSQEVSQSFPNLFQDESARAKMASTAIADFERQHQLAISIGLAAGNTKAVEEELNALYGQRLNLYKDLQDKGVYTYKQVGDAADEAAIKENQRQAALRKNLTDTQRLAQRVTQDFAAGFSNAFVEFAAGAKSASEAFKQFAASFMKQVADMILQMLILRAIEGIGNAIAPGAGTLLVGGAKAGGAAEGGQFPSRAAFGGQFPIMAANGVAGVHELSAPTYFPRFNVLAGEAGREVMTVMARPRLMDIGGIAAQVGDVGPNRLALTNANDLQRLGSGAGGKIQIEVGFREGLLGSVVNEASDVAVVKVTHKMGERGPLSERTRRLINQ